MEGTLDEDFVNFESVSQSCVAAPLIPCSNDEELSLLDNEVTQRERNSKGDKKGEKNKKEVVSGNPKDPEGMKPPCQELEGGAETPPLASEEHLFTTFSYNSASKRLTMIPFKYKVKEERRKVLKISVNKLKKIDDPESWLCRSVLINNTMKKLQKEARDEKINKQMNAMTYSKTFLSKSENDEFGQLNNNNNNTVSDNNNSAAEVFPVEAKDDECFYQKDIANQDEFYQLSNKKSEEFMFEMEKTTEVKVKESEEEEEEKVSISGGVSINEDFVEKIPSIKRCGSRKKSVDEDGPANEILNLKESDLATNQKSADLDDVDECDVHDVLSQLYMPPTPRMLTSIDSDTDDDELNVVDIDSSYIDNIKCPKLPNDLFGNGLPPSGGVKRECEDDKIGNAVKRRKIDDVFECFGEESYDNFLCSNRNKESERTSVETGKDACSRNQDAEEELIELEDEEDIKRRLSQSLSNHYHRKPDKTCDNFFEDNCDNQYSCGHTVTMFNDMQSVTFHNLIASLET